VFFSEKLYQITGNGNVKAWIGLMLFAN